MSNPKPTGTTVTLASSMLLASLGTSIANVALPTLTEAFAAPFAEVQAVVVAYLAGLTVFVIIAGRLGDRCGLKPMLIVGLGVSALASALCALAPCLWVLVGARALQGVGAAFLMTLAMALIRRNADPAHLGRSLGLLGTASALGTALGPSLGGLLIPVTGWQGIFWAQVPLTLLTLLATIAIVPGDARRGSAPAPSLWSVLDRALAPKLVLNLLVAGVMMTTLVVGPFYLDRVLGLSTPEIGLVMAIGPVISIASGIPAGRLVDHWGSRRVLSLGITLLAGGALLLAFLPNQIGVAGYGLAITVLTPGYQLFQAANTTAVLADVPQDRRGTVSGLLGFARNIGLIAGASVMGAVFAVGVGTQDFGQATADAVAAGMQLTFLLAAGVLVLARQRSRTA